jgi:hypothetical protein
MIGKSGQPGLSAVDQPVLGQAPSFNDRGSTYLLKRLIGGGLSTVNLLVI